MCCRALERLENQQMLEEDGAFCHFAPGHFLTFFEYAKFSRDKKIQEVKSKMVIIERATDLWNPTLGTLSFIL